VLSDRGKYIAAALTICRAYIVAGRPGKADRLASFEGWSDTVRSTLIWLGKEDPVLSMESAKEEDPERLELSDMMEAWAEAIGIGSGSRVKLSAVLDKGAAMSRPHEGADLEPDHPDLHAALTDIYRRGTGKTGLPDGRMLGKWLQRFRSRIINDKRFMRQPSEKHGSEWWVERVNETTGVSGVNGVNFKSWQHD
jgi:putative DNA primase/helicase